MIRKPRRVFGRRRVAMCDTVYQIELRKDCVAARELRSSREYSVPLDKLIDILMMKTSDGR